MHACDHNLEGVETGGWCLSGFQPSLEDVIPGSEKFSSSIDRESEEDTNAAFWPPHMYMHIYSDVHTHHTNT